MKIGIDGGGGFLKVCMNILGTEDQPVAKKQRFSYSTGVWSKNFLDGGVKKLFILANVEQVGESYENLKSILDLLKISSVSFAQALDVKCILLLCGLGAASSTYPCAWCELSKNHFDDPCMIHSSNLRSLGSIRKNALLYQEASSNSKRKTKLSSANFLSCERPPLFDYEDSVFIIDFIAPPELHLFTGIFNHVFDHLDKILDQIDGCEISALSWSDAKGISRSSRHGGKFNGGPVKTLLGSIETLEAILQENNVVDQCSAIVAVFQTFKDVVENCFGKHLANGYKESINNFSQAYRKVEGLSVTPKVHCLEAHVAQFLDRQSETFPGFGLGFWSEQASESVHYDFKHLWNGRNYVRDLAHADYDKNLLKCAVTYNSRHL